ncbi:MAG: serine hydrolase [Proteobacteria bacterium]|nr:serine hydrolase [Pseudomonadota bacterium]MCP4918092.1 serine hydrolase [Pseudomonadota bacterium]
MLFLALACSESDLPPHDHDVDCDCPELVDDTAVDDGRDEAWARIEAEALDQLHHDYVPGIALAVVLDGETAFVGAWGDAQYGSSIPLTVDTRMRWNSVSKMHVALATLGLVEEGVLDLETPVSEYTDLSGEVGDLTLHQAMTHTTALPDWWTTQCSVDIDEYWAGYDNELHAEPGTLYNYSNVGWSLVGHVLEEQTGQDFISLMDERVLEPAGMDNASFDVSMLDEVPASIGYDSGSWYTPDLHDCGYLRPAGWLHASILDLASMVELLLDGGGDLVSEGTLEAAWAQHPAFNAAASDAGYGFFTWEDRGIRLVGHGGAGGGHMSYLLLAPDHDVGVAVAFNTRDVSPYTLAYEALGRFVEGWGEPNAEEVTSGPDVWVEYEGTYRDPDGVGRVEVSMGTADKLYVRFLDGSNTWFRLYQNGRDEFFYSQNGWNYVRFVPDGGDTRYIANRYWVAERDGAEGPVPEQARVLDLEVAGAWDEPMRPGDWLY